jgi:hypothetical protein
MANHAAQVFYAEQILSANDQKKSTDKPKHVVFPGKQQAIGVDGVSDLDELNQFSDMQGRSHPRGVVGRLPQLPVCSPWTPRPPLLP